MFCGFICCCFISRQRCFKENRELRSHNTCLPMSLPPMSPPLLLRSRDTRLIPSLLELIDFATMLRADARRAASAMRERCGALRAVPVRVRCAYAAHTFTLRRYSLLFARRFARKCARDARASSDEYAAALPRYARHLCLRLIADYVDCCFAPRLTSLSERFDAAERHTRR